MDTRPVRKFLPFIFVLSLSPAQAEGPHYKQKDTYAQQEFDNVYQDLRSVRNSVSNLLNSTNTWTGANLFSSSTSLKGSTDGSSASTGYYAEEISSAIAGNKAWSLSTGNYMDVATMTVPAGDWLIYGCVGFVGAPTGTALVSSLTTSGGSSAAGQLVADNTNQIPTMPTATADVNLPIPLPQHVIVTASTPYYLKAAATFSAGTVKAYGTIRRVRNPH